MLVKMELNLELQAFYTGHMERTYLQGPNEIGTGLRSHRRRNTLLGRIGGPNHAAVPIRVREPQSEHENHQTVVLLFHRSRLARCANLAATH